MKPQPSLSAPLRDIFFCDIIIHIFFFLGGRFSNASEILDTSSMSWSATGTMQVERSRGSWQTLLNGTFFFFFFFLNSDPLSFFIFYIFFRVGLGCRRSWAGRGLVERRIV